MYSMDIILACHLGSDLGWRISELSFATINIKVNIYTSKNGCFVPTSDFSNSIPNWETIIQFESTVIFHKAHRKVKDIFLNKHVI